MKQRLKDYKGITLVALILAVVAITSISKSNIIKHSQNAKNDYIEAKENESKILSEYEQYIKDNTKKTDSNTDFEKYILGPDGKGRTLIGENGIIDDNNNFIDDPLTDVDETKTLSVEYLTVGFNENDTKLLVYVKYSNKAYRVTTDGTADGVSTKSEKLELVYEPKGTEGQKTADGWTILYDNENTIEAVSPETMGTLRLGYAEGTTDSETKITEAINSYNNAITIINDYCKSLGNIPTNNGIRSVGAGTETTTDKYYSDNLKKINSKYNGVGLKGDINYEQDFVRMAYWNVDNVGKAYWMASRCARDDSPYTEFYVRHIDESGLYSGATLLNVLWNSDGTATANEDSFAVRPIITINK